MAFTVTSLTRIAGLHHWPAAPVHRFYLAASHRHLFHVRATVEVAHEGRQVEFHDLGQLVTDHLHGIADWQDGLASFGAMSCEAIAKSVADYLTGCKLQVREVSCSEDDEFTATWRPE